MAYMVRNKIETVNSLKNQQKLDMLYAAFKRELEKQAATASTGVILITAEIRIHEGGIRTSEMQGGFRFSV